MIILRVEHKIQNFDDWKKVFDSDPIKRKQSGVRRYRIFRPTDDPNYVIIDLEFDDAKSAEVTLGALRTLWRQAVGKIMMNPQARILNMVEAFEY